MMKSLFKFSLLLIPVFLLIFIIGCGKKESENISTDELKKKELELKEKELNLKEKEMLDKKESELKEKEQKIDKFSHNKLTDINGTYEGTIKNGTSWFVIIKDFDGSNFNGYDIVYWKTTPNGYRTSFHGTYDNNTKEIIIYEDKNIKGSGKFIGNVSADHEKMSGTWYRYSDGGSFTWELSKSYEENQ
jgi:hypothetical protein